MCPYLKGVHLSLDVWRGGRDKDGWKKSRRELSQMISDSEGVNEFWGDLEASKDVTLVHRLLNNLFTLEFLLEGLVRRRNQAILSKTGWVSYRIGDKSRNGYGSAVYLN